MYLCSDGHEEICYESRDCPLCIVLDEASEKIEELEAALEDALDELRELKRGH